MSPFGHSPSLAVKCGWAVPTSSLTPKTQHLQKSLIDGGRAAELGTHEELLAKGGIYAGLWSEQLRTGGWRLPKRMGGGRGPWEEIEGQ